MDERAFNNLLKDWDALRNEINDLEDPHESYLIKAREALNLQEKCQKSVKHAISSLSQLKTSIKSFNNEKCSEDVKSTLNAISEQLVGKQRRLIDMKRELPVQSSGLYLSVILGSNLNVSLVNKNEKYRYKQEYEKFKITVNCTLLFLLLFSFIFPLKIKGWWKMHHYVSCVLSGITVTWRDGECYRSVRNHLALFFVYLSFVQILQCRYQRGCLRRLLALGQRHSMDITVEGFSSWMFKGLTFLIPFLVVAYAIQFYNAHVLYTISMTEKCSRDWQAAALAFGFLLLGVCNSLTLLAVLVNKWKDSRSLSTILDLTSKYSFRAPKTD